MPSFSNIAAIKNGRIQPIIKNTAISSPTVGLEYQYTGKPITPPTEKLIICLNVRLSATLVLTLLRSFGTDTYAILIPPRIA